MTTNETLLIWCGDSWTNGAGLDISNKKKLRFTSLIGQHLNVNTINLSKSGSSIEHLVYKVDQILRIKKKFPNKKIIVLLGLTVPYRLCIETINGERSTVSVNSFDICAYKQWADNIFNNNDIIKKNCIAISWVADQLQKHNIIFKFYNILCNQYDFNKSSFVKYLDSKNWLVNSYWSAYSEIYDVEKFDFDKMSILEKTTRGKESASNYLLVDKHPNSAGHIKIANRLLPEIKLLLND